MGCTTLSGAKRDYFDRTFNQARPTGYKLEVFCDGAATKWTPLLANNEIWIDASAFYRQGLNFGVSMQYQGAGSCLVYGSMANRDSVRLVQQADQAAIVTATLPSWVQIGADPETPAALAPGMVAQTDVVYDMFKLVFTGAGSVTMNSL